MKILIRSKLKKEVNDCYLQCRHHIRCPLFSDDSNKIKERQLEMTAFCISKIISLDYPDYLNLFCDVESLSIRNKTEVERILRYKTYNDFVCCSDCFNKFFF